MPKIKLKLVTEDDMMFLFEMIKIRDKREFLDRSPISYDSHVKFITKFLTKPETHHYEKFYVVLLDEKKIGTVVLMKRNNEVGYYFMPEFRNKGYGTTAMELLFKENPRSYYTAHIHNYNKDSMRFFERLGASPEGIWYNIRKNQLNSLK